MMDEKWFQMDPADQDSKGVARSGALKMAMFFSAAVIALTAFVAPYATDRAQEFAFSQPDPYDQLTTGSISTVTAFEPGEPSRVYTIQRSILQETPGALCIVNVNGSKTGDC